jgi:hypothetical protein
MQLAISRPHSFQICCSPSVLNRNFKAYYTKYVMLHLKVRISELGQLRSLCRAMPYALLSMCFHLHSRLGETTGMSFVDATPLAVCHNRRIARHKVFAGLIAYTHQTKKPSLNMSQGDMVLLPAII